LFEFRIFSQSQVISTAAGLALPEKFLGVGLRLHALAAAAEPGLEVRGQGLGVVELAGEQAPILECTPIFSIFIKKKLKINF